MVGAQLRPGNFRRQSRLITALGLVLGVSLLAWGAAYAAPSDNPLAKPDRIAVDKRGDVLELSWSDTEERLQGAISPEVPREGEPLKVLLNVGSFQGAEFSGPITVTLREDGSMHGLVKTVNKGAVNWTTEFIPERSGPHQLDVSFRTTRLKVLHADFEVAPSLVPRFFLWGLVGLMAGLALLLGVRSLLRKEKAPELHPILAEIRAAEAAAAPPPPAESPAEAESSTGSTPDKPSAL